MITGLKQIFCVREHKNQNKIFPSGKMEIPYAPNTLLPDYPFSPKSMGLIIPRIQPIHQVENPEYEFQPVETKWTLPQEYTRAALIRDPEVLQARMHKAVGQAYVLTFSDNSKECRWGIVNIYNNYPAAIANAKREFKLWLTQHLSEQNADYKYEVATEEEGRFELKDENIIYTYEVMDLQLLSH